MENESPPDLHTVDSHLRHIYQRLEVNTRIGAVAKAFKEKTRIRIADCRLQVAAFKSGALFHLPAPFRFAAPSSSPHMQRPDAVSVIGILNIVFGVYALFSVFTTSSTLAITGKSKNPIVKIMHEHPAYATWVKCTIPLGLLSFALLLSTGVGLLCLGEWARKLSIAYGIYAILFDIAVAIINFVFVLPPGIPGPSHTDGGGNPALVAAVIAIMGGVFGLIYPVVLIVFMTRREIAAAFRPPAEPSVRPAV